MQKKDILEILKNVYDPDYADKSVADLALIDENGINLRGDRIEIEYKVTAMMCPFGSAIGAMIRYALEKKLGRPVKVRIEKSHFQERVVNEALGDEEKYKDLIGKLHSYGILEQCVRV